MAADSTIIRSAAGVTKKRQAMIRTLYISLKGTLTDAGKLYDFMIGRVDESLLVIQYEICRRGGHLRAFGLTPLNSCGTRKSFIIAKEYLLQ